MRKLEFRGEDLTPDKLQALGLESELEHLVIWGGPLVNDDLVPLAQLTELKQLVLGEMRIDDGVFAHLEHLSKLETLILAYTANRGDLTALTHLPLRDLRLEGCRFVGDACAETLAKMPGLRHLEMHMTGLTDRGVAALAALPLENLWLGPRVTDASMETLSKMPTLRHLDICAHNVSDVGAKMLATLPKLEVLWLTRCDITDACVEALGSVSTLRELNVNCTGVSADGIRTLRSALPQCRFPEPD